MPYPTYMDQLGAWPSSPDPITSWKPSAPPTAQPPSVTGTTDPNADLSSQAIMDMVRRKQEAYGQEPWSGVGSPLTGQTPDLRSLYQTPDGAQGVATRNPDITNQISATSDAAGMMQSPTNADNRATQLPSDQRTLIGGSPALTRGLPPEVYNNILKQTAGDPRYDSAQITGRNETTGQDFTAQPGRRIPLSVAQSIAAKQQLDQALAQGNQQAELANQRGIARARVPGQNAVDLQVAKNTGGLALQQSQNQNEQTLQQQRLDQQQKQWEDNRPMREAQVKQIASQIGLNDADTKARLASIENMDTPAAKTAHMAMQYAATLAPEDPSKGDIFSSALQSIGGQGGQGATGISQAIGQSNQFAADRNTAQYMASDPEFAATVKALKGAKPGIGTAIAGGIAKAAGQDFGTTFGMDRVKQGNEQKWINAVQQTQEHFNTIAARKHLNAKQLMDGAMKQVQ